MQIHDAFERCGPQIEFCGGDYTRVVPPVPISNTEVKYPKADDSVMNAKVGSRHRSTQSQSKNCHRGVFLCKKTEVLLRVPLSWYGFLFRRCQLNAYYKHFHSLPYILECGKRWCQADM